MKLSFGKQEARSQKRKAISPEPRDEELDHEINNLEAIHQQVEKSREKILRLSELLKKIDEATEEMRNIEQHEHQHNYRHLQHDSHNYDNLGPEAYNL
jgi:hypothetical protein